MIYTQCIHLDFNPFALTAELASFSFLSVSKYSKIICDVTMPLICITDLVHIRFHFLPLEGTKKASSAVNIKSFN